MTEWSTNPQFWMDIQPWMFRKTTWDAVPKQVDEVVRLLHIQADDRILDMCCGPGRHSLELARRSFAVTGVDLVEAYIAEARQRAQQEALRVEFIAGDMRSFCRPGEFDVVLNLSTSMGAFENENDNKSSIANMFASLSRSGRLLADVVGKEQILRHLTERGEQASEGMKISSRISFDEDQSRLIIYHDLLVGSAEHHLKLSYRLYTQEELCELLTSCGFREVDVFGGFDGSLYDEKARKLVVVAYK